MLAAGEAQIVGVSPGRARVVALDLAPAHALQDRIIALRVGLQLHRRIDLEIVVVVGEGVHADVAFDDVVAGAADAVRAGIGQGRVLQDQLGEGVLLQLIQEVQTLGPGQVVEAVAVLQVLKLRLEHSVEGRAQHAAERHLLFGQTADPKINGVHAGLGRRTVQPGDPRGPLGRRLACRAEDQIPGRRPLVGRGRRPGDAGVRAIGGDEVHHRQGVLQVGGEIDPVLIGLQEGRAGRGVKLGPRVVQRRDARVATARDVDGRQVQRQAQQVVAQGAGDELVDLVAAHPGHAGHDGGGGLVRRAQGVHRAGIEEGLDQTDLAL